MAKTEDYNDIVKDIEANVDKCGYHTFFYENTIIRFVLTGETDCILEIE